MKYIILVLFIGLTGANYWFFSDFKLVLENKNIIDINNQLRDLISSHNTGKTEIYSKLNELDTKYLNYWYKNPVTLSYLADIHTQINQPQEALYILEEARRYAKGDLSITKQWLYNYYLISNHKLPEHVLSELQLELDKYPDDPDLIKLSQINNQEPVLIITVEDSLPHKLKDLLTQDLVVYVYVLSKNNAKMPVAVKKLAVGELLEPIVFTDIDSMLPTRKLSQLDSFVVKLKVLAKEKVVTDRGLYSFESSSYDLPDVSERKLTLKLK